MDKTVKRLETEKTRIERELNDEIELLKTSKKKQKATIDEQTTKLDETTKDLKNAQRELRSITQVSSRNLLHLSIVLTTVFFYRRKRTAESATKSCNTKLTCCRSK